MDAVAEIKINWKEYKPGGCHPLQSVMDSIRLRLDELKSYDDRKFLMHEDSFECSYVYWGCGSCGADAAQVAAYCGGGGSEPDYSFCEAC